VHIARNYRCLKWGSSGLNGALLTEINRETGRLNNPRRLTLDENRNVVNAWTPDSRAVLFLSNRNGTYKLFRQNIDRATLEVLAEGRSIRLLRLNADGTRILYLAGPNPQDPVHLVSVVEVSLEGGSPRLILQKPFILNIKCARSPSKLCLLYAVQGSTTHFFSFDPESGQTQEFASLPVSEVHCDLSPDGTQLAFFLPGPERHANGRPEHARCNAQ
jgi:Tol biopolymer transport system component